MTRVAVTATARWRWWFRFYLAALRLGMAVTGSAPNWERVEWWIRHGLVVSSPTARASGSNDGRIH